MVMYRTSANNKQKKTVTTVVAHPVELLWLSMTCMTPFIAVATLVDVLVIIQLCVATSNHDAALPAAVPAKHLLSRALTANILEGNDSTILLQLLLRVLSLYLAKG